MTDEEKRAWLRPIVSMGLQSVRHPHLDSPRPYYTEQVDGVIDALIKNGISHELYEKINALKEEVNALKSENAELHERLDKSIILPCKVGDIIYIITFGYNGKHVTPNNFADCWSYGMEEVEVTEDNLFIMCNHFRDGSAFFDRADAEARLAELKEEKY